ACDICGWKHIFAISPPFPNLASLNAFYRTREKKVALLHFGVVSASPDSLGTVPHLQISTSEEFMATQSFELLPSGLVHTDSGLETLLKDILVKWSQLLRTGSVTLFPLFPDSIEDAVFIIPSMHSNDCFKNGTTHNLVKLFRASCVDRSEREPAACYTGSSGGTVLARGKRD
ncbi:hypothetical protein DNTS_030884, partial [Danionella cerebrum]